MLKYFSQQAWFQLWFHCCNMFKLLVAIGFFAMANSACVDKYSRICRTYDGNRKQGVCDNNSWVRANCKRFCGRCVYEQPNCGRQLIPMSRVVGGKDAIPGSWPWQIGIYFNGRFECGGSLLNEKWVVTAARCVDRMSKLGFKIALGDHDRDRSEGEQEFDVTRIIVHPKFNHPRRLNNDIALMELRKPAMFNNRVQPVCLPKQGERQAVGSKCYITGWGKYKYAGFMDPILQQLKLTVQSQSACNNSNSKYIPITNQMICGANPTVSENQSGCHSDSGGPFVCQQSNGKWKLQGVVSWGSPRCDIRDSYTVFARVAEFRTWIDQYISA